MYMHRRTHTHVHCTRIKDPYSCFVLFWTVAFCSTARQTLESTAVAKPTHCAVTPNQFPLTHRRTRTHTRTNTHKRYHAMVDKEKVKRCQAACVYSCLCVSEKEEVMQGRCYIFRQFYILLLFPGLEHTPHRLVAAVSESTHFLAANTDPFFQWWMWYVCRITSTHRNTSVIFRQAISSQQLPHMEYNVISEYCRC